MAVLVVRIPVAFCVIVDEVIRLVIPILTLCPTAMAESQLLSNYPLP